MSLELVIEDWGQMGVPAWAAGDALHVQRAQNKDSRFELLNLSCQRTSHSQKETWGS